MSDWIEVGKVDDVVSSGWLQVNLDGTLVVTYHIDGNFYAVEDICTHDGAVLSGCPLEGDEIICPRHGARFSVKTGKVTAPPPGRIYMRFRLKWRRVIFLLRMIAGTNSGDSLTLHQLVFL